MSSQNSNTKAKFVFILVLLVAAVVAGFYLSGYIVLMQLNGPEAGQSVPHFHIHVIPGSIADLRKPHATVMADQGELKALAAKIVAALD